MKKPVLMLFVFVLLAASQVSAMACSMHGSKGLQDKAAEETLEEEAV